VNKLIFNNPLSHSAAQNFHLVQVFLNSSLCLLHFANYISNNKNILFRSVVKRTFYISEATPLPTLQKKLLAQFLEKTRTLRNLRQ
jgi:hypothetical protein